jgi:hypothetical protein
MRNALGAAPGPLWYSGRVQGVAILCGLLGLGDSGPPLTVTAPADPVVGLATCAASLERVRRAIDALEPKYHARASAKSLFEDGPTPNPAAVKALTPALERVLRDKGEVTLDCHAWACRALVIDPLKSRHDWMAPLHADPELAERTRDKILVEPLRKTVEALSDRAVAQWTVYLKLADATGRRIPDSRGTMVFAAAAPPPATVDECRAGLAAAETELGAMRVTLQRDRTPAERWAADVPNRPLTDDTRARVRRALAVPAGAPDPEVECRGTICRVTVSTTLIPDDNDFRTRLWPHAELRTRLLGFTPGRPWYWKMRDVTTAEGREVLSKRIAELEASPDFRRCQAQPPGQGKLQVRFSLAGNRGNPWSGDHVELEYLGRLADTPLGRCVANQAAAIVEAPPLPGAVSAATIYRTYQFAPR